MMEKIPQVSFFCKLFLSLHSQTTQKKKASEYRAKLKSLKADGDKIELRVSEQTNRPIAASYILYTVGLSRELVVNISTTREVTEEDIIEMNEELDVLEKWVNDKLEEQSKLQPHEEPAFTSDQIYKRWKRIELELKALARKPRKKAPKPAPKTTIETGEEEAAEPQPDEVEPQTDEVEPQTNESEGVEETPTQESEGGQKDEKHDEL